MATFHPDAMITGFMSDTGWRIYNKLWHADLI